MFFSLSNPFIGWNIDNTDNGGWGATATQPTSHNEGRKQPQDSSTPPGLIQTQESSCGNSGETGGGWGAQEGSGAWGADDEDRSGRPDFSKRGPRGGDYERKNNWREIHGVVDQPPEVAQEIVDNLIQNLQTVQVKLADKQADVNSPLYSAKSFEQLGLYAPFLKAQFIYNIFVVMQIF